MVTLFTYFAVTMLKLVSYKLYMNYEIYITSYSVCDFIKYADLLSFCSNFLGFSVNVVLANVFHIYNCSWLIQYIQSSWACYCQWIKTSHSTVRQSKYNVKCHIRGFQNDNVMIPWIFPVHSNLQSFHGHCVNNILGILCLNLYLIYMKLYMKYITSCTLFGSMFDGLTSPSGLLNHHVIG